jgi:alkanesulfonate monooxygenase SsuD/methylene tetrahydromethanopterin reductase-like flavin-dependent oxidoreductase (luciferase family)
VGLERQLIGTSEEVVRKLQEYKDAGADEINIYGQTPAECEKLAQLWRERPEANIEGAQP